jgi:hypothetical protein
MNAIVTATRIGNYCLVCTFSSLAIQAIATNEGKIEWDQLPAL